METLCTLKQFAWLYVLISTGLLWSSTKASGSSFTTPGGLQLQNLVQTQSGSSQTSVGVRSGVSHIYHKDSSHRPKNCDDRCIHELRYSNTLHHANLRKRSMKVSGWRGETGSSFFPSSLVGEWYTTFLVGTTAGDTGENQKVQLLLDTGVYFTWFQCAPCKKCFPQALPLFEPSKSTSYRQLNENDDYCGKVQAQMGKGATPTGCRYQLGYGDETLSRGSVAEDAFKLQDMDKPGNILAIFPVGFGCGSKTQYYSSGPSAGVLGLSNSTVGLSFREQVSWLLGTKFSYCLAPLTEPADSGFILFGEASTPTGIYFSTPLLRQDTYLFYVDLVDLSVDGERLNLPPGTFDSDSEGNGGVVVDSGTPYSFLPGAAVDLLVAKVKPAFDRLGELLPDDGSGFGPCWNTRNFDEKTFPFPTIAWHFRDGTNLEVSRAGSYILYNDTTSHHFAVCLPLVADRGTDDERGLIIIGGQSQVHTLMFYDQVNERLGWVYDSC